MRTVGMNSQAEVMTHNVAVGGEHLATTTEFKRWYEERPNRAVPLFVMLAPDSEEKPRDEIDWGAGYDKNRNTPGWFPVFKATRRQDGTVSLSLQFFQPVGVPHRNSITLAIENGPSPDEEST